MGTSGKRRKKLKCPSIPGEEDEGHFAVETIDEKMVSDYTGLDFFRLESLPIFLFWQYLRDAYVWGWMHAKGGPEYLEKCWTLSQTEPDRKSLRREFK